jgi:hypothetical protein
MAELFASSRLCYRRTMTDEPESLILRMLRDMRAEMATKNDVNDLRSEISELRADTRSDIHSLRADVASDIINVQADLKKARQDLGDQIVGLRRAVMEYHTSVIGHGVLISELEARVRRVEQHLNLPSMDSN